MVWITQFIVIFGLFKTNFAATKLFKTENMLSAQSYDCVYFTNLTATNLQATPYCIRTNESVPLDRSFTRNTCENSGKEWTLRSLKEMNVSQDEILRWSSSIEMADRYAAYLTTGYVNAWSSNFTDKLCLDMNISVMTGFVIARQEHLASFVNMNFSPRIP